MNETVKRIGYVLFSTLAGFIVLTILGGIWIVGSHFLKGGAATDYMAQRLGTAVGTFGLGVGGPLGALFGAWIGAAEAKTDQGRAANPPGWIAAATIAIFLFYAEFLAR